MRDRLRRLAALHIGLFAVVAAWVGYWQVVRGPDLAHHSENPRLLLAEDRVQRGRILDRRLEVLAGSVRRGGRTVRVYPKKEVFAHPVGYRSLLLGKSGLEASADAELLGMAEADSWRALRARAGRPRRGLDVVTTLDARLQREVWFALGPRAGAAVVVELGGGVVASASRPGFDPNHLEETWAELRWSPTMPLVDRALSGLYPPGRPFGIVVLSAALSRGLVTLHSPVDCGGSGTQRIRLVRDVLTGDCDRALIQLGVALGGRVLREMAEALGLGQLPATDVPAAAGGLPELDERDREALARVASGEGGVLVSPLQMAAVAATVARGGERVSPYFVMAVRGEVGIVHRAPARPAMRILAPEVAHAVLEAMRVSGKGGVPAVTGVVRAAKEKESVGWFVGVAPAQKPRLAVAVLLEGASEEVANGVAQKVVEAALRGVR